MTAPPTYKWLRERWEKNQKAEREIYAKVASTKRPSGRKIITELKAYHAASGGDRRFAEAVNAIQEHAFDRADAGTWKRARVRAFGPTNGTIVSCMRRSLRRQQSLKRKPSVRHAAATAAWQCYVDGKNFAAAERHCRDIWRQAEELEKSHPPKNT